MPGRPTLSGVYPPALSLPDSIRLIIPLAYGGRSVASSPGFLLADPVGLIEDKTTAIIDELIDSLPDPKRLTREERRGIIARYTSVLEGNFIYWMTAAALAAKAEQS